MNHGNILREMFTRLGDEIAESGKQIVSDTVSVGHSTLVDHATDFRIEILPVPLKLQIKSHVIDSGDHIIDFLNRNADIIGEFSAVCWTLWQSPIVRIFVASLKAQQFIAIGLT